MKSSVVLLATLLCGLLPGAGADPISGPHRMTLADEAWGTIYYEPRVLKDYSYVRDNDGHRRELVSSLGTVKIIDTGIGAYELKGPKETIKVEGGSTQVQVTFKGQTYHFARDGRKLQVEWPKNHLTYQVSGDDVSVQGNFGQTRIHSLNGHYQVTSPKGDYSYTPLDGGGFQVKGGPLMKHPGLYRGAVFSSDGVGVFVDFIKLDSQNPLFPFLEFDSLLNFH